MKTANKRKKKQSTEKKLKVKHDINKKQQKYEHYHQEKLIKINMLLVKKYLF